MAAVFVPLLISMAVGAGVSAIMSKGRRITIPIGPFSITIGKGKPSFSFGIPIPVGDKFNLVPSITYHRETGDFTYGLGVNTPIGDAATIGASITVGKGRKPMWAIDIAGKMESGVGASLGVSWEGFWKDPEVSVGVGLPIGDKIPGEKDIRKRVDFKAKWSKKKFGIGVSKDGHSIYLVKPKEGKPSVEYEFKKIRDPKKIREIADAKMKTDPTLTLKRALVLAEREVPKTSLGIKIGPKGLEKLYVASEFYPKTSGGRKDYYIQLEASWAPAMGPAFEFGVGKYKGGVYQLKYNPQKNKVEIRALLDEGLPQIQLILQKGKKFRTEIAVSEALLKRIGKEIGAQVEKTILRAIPKKWMDRVPDSVVKFLIENFPTMPEAMPERVEEYVQKYFGEKKPLLYDWQVELARKYAHGDVTKDFVHFKVNQMGTEMDPAQKRLAIRMILGQIPFSEYLRSASPEEMRVLEKEYMKKRKIPPPSDYPPEEREAIIKLFKGDYDTMRGFLEQYSPEQRKSIRGFFMNVLEDVKSYGQGIGKLMGGVAYGVSQWITEPAQTFGQVTSGEGWALLGKTLGEAGWETLKRAGKFFELIAPLAPPIFRPDLPWEVFQDIQLERKEKLAAEVGEEFYKNPVSTAFDISVMITAAGGLLSKASTLIKSPVWRTALEEVALGTSRLGRMTNPFHLFWEGVKAPIKIAGRIPAVQRALEIYKQTALYRSILTESDKARFLETIARQELAKEALKDIRYFGVAERKAVTALLQGMDINSATMKLMLANVMPEAKMAMQNFAAIMKAERNALVRMGLLTKKQAAKRAMLPLAKQTGKSIEQLYKEGYRPIYYPWMSDTQVKFSDLFWSGKMSEWKPGFLKSWKGQSVDIITDPAVVLSKYETGMARLKANVQLLDDLAKAPYTKPYVLGDSILPGHVAFNPQGYAQFVKASEKLGGNFLEQLMATGEIDSSLYKAMKFIFPDEPGVLKTMGAVPKYTYWQIPKGSAEAILKHFKPTNQFMEVFFDIPQNLWKTTVLTMRPAWIAYNTMSNVLLTSLAGVSPGAHLKAMMAKYRPIVPIEATGGTMTQAMTGIPMSAALKNTLPGKLITMAEQTRLGTALSKYNAFMRTLNDKIESHFRAATWISKAEADLKKIIIRDMGKNFFLANAELEKLTFAKMQNLHLYPDIVKNAIDYTNKFLIDYAKTGYIFGVSEMNVIQRVIPFWKFHKGMNLLLYKYLPTEFPFRMELIKLLGDVAQNFETEENRPEWLKNATKVGENLFFLPSGPNPFEGLFGIGQMGLGAVSPLITGPAEYITGMDLRKMEPFITPDTLWRYDPELGEVRAVRPEELRKELENVLSKIEVIDKGYDRGLYEYEEWLKERATLENQRKDLEWRISRPTRPSLTTIMARKIPIYNLLEDLFLPYAKFPTSTFLHPEPILDKKTGEPKYPISIWLEALRMFGVPIVQADIEQWKAQEAQKEKALISRTFRKMLTEQPDLLEKIRQAIESGAVEIPYRGQYIVSRSELYDTLPELFPQGAFWSQAEYEKTILGARQRDIDYIKEQAKIAIENIKWLDKDVRKVLAKEIRKERDREIERLTEMYKIQGELIEHGRVVEELKSVQEMRDQALKLIKNVEPATNLKEYFKEVLTGSARQDALRKIEEEIARSRNSVELALGLEKVMKFVRDQARPDRELQAKLEIVDKALKKELKKIFKKATVPTIRDEARALLEQSDFEAMRFLSKLNYPVTISDLQKLEEAKEMTLQSLTEEATRIINQYTGIDFEGKDLIIKSVLIKEKKAKEAVKRRYRKERGAMQREKRARYDAAVSGIEKAKEEQMKFAVTAAINDWMEFFDPAKMKTTDYVPITIPLLGLAGSWMNARGLVSKRKFDEFRKKIDVGIDFTVFAKSMLEMAKRSQKAELRAIKQLEGIYGQHLDEIFKSKIAQLAEEARVRKLKELMDELDKRLIPKTIRKMKPTLFVDFFSPTLVNREKAKLRQQAEDFKQEEIKRLEGVSGMEALKVGIPFSKAEIATFRTRNSLLNQFIAQFRKFLTNPTQAKFDSLLGFQKKIGTYAQMPIPAITVINGKRKIVWETEAFDEKALKLALKKLDRLSDVYRTTEFKDEQAEHFETYETIRKNLELVKEEEPRLVGMGIRVFK